MSMLLTVHAATGVLIGQKMKYWWLAFIIGFVLHFILDLIPHGDQKLIEGYRTKHKPRHIVQLILIDLTICIAFSIYWLLKFHDNLLYFTSIYMGLAGALLPDLLVGIHEIYPKLFKRFHKFHSYIHDKFPTKKINLPLGLMIQIVFIVILLTLYNL